MLLNKILNGLNIIKTNIKNFDFEIKKISYNSNDVNKDSIFVAIKGFKNDGHDFINIAINKGCKIFICEYELKNVNYILVKNSRIALSIISSNFFDNIHKKIKIISVTGTNGKTSISTFLYNILKNIGYKVALIGTNKYIINNREYLSNNTTPESYQLHKMFYEAKESDYIIMEVSSHSIKLNRIFGIQFYISIFTNITHDHLDFHKKFYNYLYTKSILFNNSKKVIINIDEKHSSFILNRINKNTEILTYGINNIKCDIHGKKIKFSPNISECIYANNIEKKEYNLKIKTPGLFYVYNILGVISALYCLKIKEKIFLTQIQNMSCVSGRFEVLTIPRKYYVIIDYAHTPDSMLNILLTAKKIKKGKLICVFGCGGDRDKVKRPIMGEIAYKYSDIIIITSDNPRTENSFEIINDILSTLPKYSYNKKYFIIENRKEAIFYSLNIAKTNDMILLLGKGHEKYQEINNIKYKFDEHKIVMEFFKENQNVEVNIK